MVDEIHFSRVVCVVEGIEDGFSNVDKRCREVLDLCKEGKKDP
jgi:hypothetical protein